MIGTAQARTSYYFRIWAAFNAIAFVAASRLLNRSMFAGGVTDGFFVQIRDAKQNPIVLSSPTGLLHFVRYMTVFPFDWVASNGYDPVFEAIFMVAFLSPVVLVRFKGGFRHPAQPLFFYTPLVLSYRSVLVACGMAYLFIWLFINHRRNILLAISAFLVNLSSGAVMGWIGIMVSNSSGRIRIENFGRRKKWLTGVLVIAVLGFAYSIRSKIDFFSSGASSGSSGAATAISRNTLTASIATGQWFRAILYASILASALWIFVARKRLTLTRQAIVFYLFALPTFLFEGLGPTSYIFPIAWYYLYIRPGRVPETIRTGTCTPAGPQEMTGALRRVSSGAQTDGSEYMSTTIDTDRGAR